ncbi:hypothetical protein D557_3572 [Bordetella holmesii 70147]|nr:hypothetical protein D557_3572 [Bordetella holmesii 70147]
MFAQAAAGVRAVATGQHAIQYQQVGRVAGDACRQIIGIGSQEGIVAMPVEVVGQQLAQRRIVVYDQQFGVGLSMMR